MPNVGPINQVFGEAFRRKSPGDTEIQTADLFDLSYVAAAITVGVTEVAARVGGSNLANRKLLVITNLNAGNIFFGPTGVVGSTSTAARLVRDQFRAVSLGPGVTLFLIRSGGSGIVYVEEFA